MDKNKSLALILALLVLFSVANTVQAVDVVKSIPSIGWPRMAYDSYKGEIWLTTFESTTNELGMDLIEPSPIVTAISDSDYLAVANVAVGGYLVDMAYDSALHEIWVINENFDTITIISDINNCVVATIDLNYTSTYSVYDHFGISSIVYDSGKGELFVSNYVSGYVSVISDSTREVVATIPLGNDPYPASLIYDSGKGEIFVCYEPVAGKFNANFISVISDANNSVIATIPIGNRIVHRGVYDYANGKIYTPCPSNSSILVISDETNTVVDSIPLEKNPYGEIGFDPVKNLLLVGTHDGQTYVISIETNSVVETAPISSISMVYDSGRNLMVNAGNSSIQFISDELSPSPSPTPTPTPSPTASPTPSVLQNPVFLALDWVQIAILVVIVVIVVAVVVAAFRFFSERKSGH
jgi:YVTN family beta-propeller protein